MKITNKFVTWALSLAVAASGFVAYAAPAQALEFDVSGQMLNFSNENEDDYGVEAAPGWTRRYVNVITVGSQEIDAIVTLVDTFDLDHDENGSNGADNLIDEVDYSRTPGSFDDKCVNVGLTVFEDYEGFAFANLRFEFVLGGTSTPATLTNVSIYVADIDGYQFADFSGPQSYEISTETELEVLNNSDNSSIPNGTYRFYDWDDSWSEVDDEENWAAVTYDAISSVDVRVGMDDSSDASYGICFTKPEFESSEVTTLEAATYTIIYDGNNKTAGSVPGDTVGSGLLTVANNSGNLARNGYNFLGWNTNDQGTGAIVEPGSSYRPSRDITLYAMWGEIPVLPTTTPVKMTKIIYFDSASGKITPAALKQLRKFVNSVKTIDTVTNISIYGYVQPTANNNADKALSSARAKNTASALKKLGIGRINDAVGMGKAINKSAAASRYVRIVVRGFNQAEPV